MISNSRDIDKVNKQYLRKKAEIKNKAGLFESESIFSQKFEESKASKQDSEYEDAQGFGAAAAAATKRHKAKLLFSDN